MYGVHKVGGKKSSQNGEGFFVKKKRDSSVAREKMRKDYGTWRVSIGSTGRLTLCKISLTPTIIINVTLLSIFVSNKTLLSSKPVR